VDKNLIIIADTNGVIRFWSAGAMPAFGYSSQDAIGKTLDLIVPPQHREAHWQGFRRAMASGVAAAEGRTGPFPFLRADGACEEVPGRLTLLRQAQGQVIGAMVIFG
jgi:PAS domain S-box-containing protein